MKFLLKYPSRSRPDLFRRRVENWTQKASGVHNLYWLCTFDADDASMTDPAMQAWCMARNLHCHYGPPRGKVAAINADMEWAPEADIYIIVSDDMAVLQQDWDQTVATDMLANFPDLNGALWYLDGRQDRTCTLSIMGQPIYEEIGHLYNPAFQSVYCDNFYHELMHRTGRLKRIDTPVFCHEWGAENRDALMRRNEAPELYRQDQKTFERLMDELDRTHPRQPGMSLSNAAR